MAPVLAVEALSRSTQLGDRNTKKAHYERQGVSSYWLLDPVRPGRAGGLRARRARPLPAGRGG
ncbi:MAG: Uma2 family endonuclease [Pseudonocardiaceae bacterium]